MAALRYGVLTSSEFGNTHQARLCAERVSSRMVVDEGLLADHWLQADLEHLGQLDPTAADSYRATFSTIVSVEAIDFKAASSPKIFGLGIISDRYNQQSRQDRILSMLHELAHHEMFAINLVDRLVRPEFDSGYAFAPMQGRPRPLIGRLHAAHALFRMLLISRKLGWPDEEVADLLSKTSATMPRHELTDLGSELLNVYQTV